MIHPPRELLITSLSRQPRDNGSNNEFSTFDLVVYENRRRITCQESGPNRVINCLAVISGQSSTHLIAICGFPRSRAIKNHQFESPGASNDHNKNIRQNGCLHSASCSLHLYPLPDESALAWPSAVRKKGSTPSGYFFPGELA